MPRSRLVLVLASCAGSIAAAGACGDEYGSTPAPADAAVEDASDAGASPPDAAADAAPDALAPDGGCTADMPLLDATLAAVSELNTQDLDDRAIRLTPDGLSAYFSRESLDAGAGLELHVASRTTVTAPFGTPVLLPTVNAQNNDTSATETGNRLHLFFQTGRVTPAQIYRVDRVAVGDPYGVPATISLGVPGSLAVPFVLPDGSALYFTSNIAIDAGPADLNIYRATLASDLTPLGGTLVEELATASNETHPVLTPDELTMYLAVGVGGGSGYDVHVTSRASKSAKWSAPKRLTGAINGASSEYPTFVTADGCTLYFERSSGAQFDLFRISKR